MCADHPATRAQVNIGVNSSAGTSAKSSTTADQNSTFRGEHAVGLACLQLGERCLLERLGDLDAVGAELLGGAAQHARPRVLGAVDAVAEAHEALAAVEGILDPLVGVTGSLDLVEHLQHAEGAPPWSGPLSAPTAPDRAAAASAPVEVITRAVNVDAFMPCSAALIQ